MKSVYTRLFLLILVVFSISACRKDNFDAAKQAAIDDSLMTDFIQKNNITMIKHSSGIYYQIINQGNGANVHSNSTVEVNYEGRLLNGYVFDKSTSSITFPLHQVIAGWTIGVPLIQVGGRIRLIIPSGLAYGNESPGAGIPKNSVLDFTIDLLHTK